MANVPTGIYTVTETNLPSRYATLASQTVTVTQDSIGYATVSFNNKLKVGSITILKTSGYNQLSGFTFEISKVGKTVATATTDDEGCAIVNGLPVGSYTVTETFVPA